MVGIKHESMRKGQTSHKKEHNTRMCFPLKPVFTRDKGGLPNFMDEPTAGLDPNERIRFRNLISELAEDRLVLLSTHIVSDIEYIANEIWLMKDGKLMHKGTSEEVINSMPEKVWECYVEKIKVSDFVNKYKISNMKSEANGVMLRIISLEKPFVNAKCAEPSLEDVFLYYFGEKAGVEDVEI